VKELRQPRSKGGRIPAPAFFKTEQKLARELRVVAVLAKGLVPVGTLAGPSGAEPLLYVGRGDFGPFGLDHKAQSVAQRLAQDRAGQLISNHVTGVTSRPQCLQTRARARIGSAQ